MIGSAATCRLGPPLSSIVRVAAPTPLQRALIYAASAVASVLAHGGALAVYLLWAELHLELDTPGEGTDNDGPVGNGGGNAAPAEVAPAAAQTALQTPDGPVQISLYVPPAPAPAEAAAPADPAAVAPAAAPQPSPTKRKDKAPAGEGSGEASSEASSEAARASADAGTGKASHDGVAGAGPKGAKKPCEPNDDIVQLADDKWRVPRELVDWYVAHLKELEKHVGVASHTGPDGKRDGAKLYIPRCSVLRQGGIKSGDIIHKVNGQPVTNIPQAFAVYMKVRREDTIKVELTRKDGSQRTHTYKLK